MASTVVDICNRALFMTGSTGHISSLTDGSREANACAAHWGSVTEELMEEADFSWSVGYAPLAEVSFSAGNSTEADVSWFISLNNERVFAAPSSMLRGLDVVDENEDTLPWRQTISPSGTSVILVPTEDLAETPVLKLRYIRKPVPAEGGDAEDLCKPEQWSGKFISAVEHVLASRVGMALSSSSPEALKNLSELGREILSAAVKTNAVTGDQRPVPKNAWGRVKYMALERIGRASPGGSDMGSSRQATVFKGALPSARDKILRGGKFTFATRWYEGLELAEDPAPIDAPLLTRTYVLPETDFKTIEPIVVYLKGGGDYIRDLDWNESVDSQGRRTIVLETGPQGYTSTYYVPIVKLLVDVDDLEQWPEFALSVLAWQLASDTLESVAFDGATSASKMRVAREVLQEGFAREFGKAIADDANAAGRRDIATTPRLDRFTAAGYGLPRQR